MEFKCSNDHRKSRFDEPIKYPVPEDGSVVWEYHVRNNALTGYAKATVKCPECNTEVTVLTPLNTETRELING